MNIVYRIIWNKVTGQFVVASEFARGKCKSSRSRNSALINGVSAALLFASGMSTAHAGLVASGVSQSYSDQDIVTSASNDYGIQAVLAGGEMNFTGGTINTSGISGYGVVASDQGIVNISGTQVTTTRADVQALYATRNGTINADGLTVNSNGYGAYVTTNSAMDFLNGSITSSGDGVYVVGTSTVNFLNSSVTSNNRGLVAGGLSTLTASDATINSVNQGLYANGATINGERLIVNTSARNGYGVFANGTSGIISLKNSRVNTLGDYANGLYTVNGTFAAEQNDVATSGINAHAVYATGSMANLNVTGGSLSTTGAGAAGVLSSGGALVNADNLFINSSGVALSASGATLDASNITLNTVAGSSAIAAAAGATITGTAIQGQVGDAGNLVTFDGAVGAANSVTLTNSALSVTGNSAMGINSINGNNQLALINTQLSAAEGSAITLQNGSSLTLSLEGSTLGGATLLDALASDTRAQITASNGSVMAGNITVDPAATAASSLALNDSQWSGSAANLQALTLENGSLWNMTDNSTLHTLALNDSTLNFDHSNGRSTTLTVKGDFTGTGGTLIMNTVLAGDDSDTDKLHVTGNTSGTTHVVINNAGGSGAQTLNGIELITVDGTSAGEFSQQGRIAAGAYDYTLSRGADTKNWYLTSDVNAVDPVIDPVVDPVVDPGVDPIEKPVVQPGAGKPAQMIVRPEVGNYNANIAAANTLFTLRLSDRGGETHYVDALTGEKKTTSLWMRNLGGHQQMRDSSGQIKTETNRYVLQLGGDLATGSFTGSDRLHLGAMAGYGNARSNSDSSVTGYRSQGHTNGYNVGVYGTWYQQPEQHTGAYVDSWLQYSWFNNSVNGDHLAAERYKSNGFTYSLESGYSWKVGEDRAKNRYFIEPNAQLIWMDVKADDHTEANGTRVSSQGDGNLQSRVGLRASLKTAGEPNQAVYQPFLEANWINNSNDFGSTLNGVSMTSEGQKNIAEVRVGVESKLPSRVNLWGSVGQQMGSNHYRDTSAMLGVKVSF